MLTVKEQDSYCRPQDFKVYNDNDVYLGRIKMDWDKLNRDYVQEIRDKVNEFELIASSILSRIEIITSVPKVARCPLCGSIHTGLLHLPLSKEAIVCDDCGYMSDTFLDNPKDLKYNIEMWNALSSLITDKARQSSGWFDSIQCTGCPQQELQDSTNGMETCWQCSTACVVPEGAVLRQKVVELYNLHNVSLSTCDK